MANAIGIIGGNSCLFQTDRTKNSKEKLTREDKRVGFYLFSACATSVNDPYKTLRIRPNASKSEVKKAFRKLALQYHPDVCKGNNDGVQFHHINEAYDTVMSQIREEITKQEMDTYEPNDAGMEEVVMGMDDPDCELWEEWMGWEGAGIRDYSSHINPYI